FRVADPLRPDTKVVDRVFDSKDGLETDWVFSLFESSDHRFWVGTNKAILEYFPNREPKERFRAYSRRNGLSFQEITCLAEDISGNLWLGTNAAGAMKMAR